MADEIYYFSGTGNSLHVARELQKKMPGAVLIPIVHLLQNSTIRTNADRIGLVFPNFCLTIPIAVHDFLEKADLNSARYIYAVCTRGGSPSEAFVYINEIIKKQGKKINAQLNINMPWNHPLGKENLTDSINDKNLENYDREMQNKLETFSRCIREGEEYIRPDDDVILKLPSWMNAFNGLISRSFNYKSHNFMYQKLIGFYSDSKCNGCTICEKVCLAGKIKLINKKPGWEKGAKCYACFACINFCPQQAIQIKSNFLIKSYTDVNGRYHHSAVSCGDIAAQR